MFKLIKFLFIAAFILGGWALAAASLHVVRTPAPEGRWWLPVQIQFMTKSEMGWKDTWVDTTKWTEADLAWHPDVVKRLDQTGRDFIVKQVKDRPAPAIPAETFPVSTPAKDVPDTAKDPKASPPVADDGKAKPRSIFDFSGK